jgi:hypothetical protein
MSDAPRYRIETIRDFLNVPPDRLQACLGEFFQFLEYARLAAKLASGEDVKFSPIFTWIDDGMNNATIRFHVNGEEICSFEVKGKPVSEP